MLRKIAYLFPEEDNSDFNTYLFCLFEKLPNVERKTGELVLSTINPSGAHPVTTIQLSDGVFPQIYCEMNEKIALQVGNLSLSSQLNAPHHVTRDVSFTGTERADNLGPFMEMTLSKDTYFLLSLKELYQRISAHIVRIDHTGVNIPASLVTKNQFKHLVGKFAEETNIYRYPTGEDWPFILPATADEFQKDINDFPIGREPKFELVYDALATDPTIQFDIETDLTRTEVETLLPEPYGVSFPDLADYFRTVYIYHNWAHLSIRFDIRFKNDTPDGDWETGKWLVADGGRIKG